MSKSLLMLIVFTTGCNVFDPRSGALECSGPADCIAPRVCQNGFCIVPGAMTDAAPNPDVDLNAPDADTGLLSCIIAIVDDFADGVSTPDWLQVPDVGITLEETNGVLRVTLPDGPALNRKGGYDSVDDTFDLTGRAFFVEIPQMVSLATNASVIVTIGQNGSEKIFATQKQGILEVELRDGGMFMLASFAYSSTTHRWWQFIESGGMLRFETSADGMSWTMQAMTATPSFLTSSGVSLLATVNTGTAAPGVAEFDNANGGGLFNPCQ